MRSLVLGLVALVLVTTFATPEAAWAGMGSEKLLKVGEPAPTFTFSDVNSGVVLPAETLARGEPLILVFLQTACRSCYGEMLTLKKLHQDPGGFSVLGVFLDMKPKNFSAYVEENGLPFHFTWDANYSIAETYGVAFTPATFLLGRDRKIAAVYRGYHPGMEKALKEDLGRLRGAP